MKGNIPGIRTELPTKDFRYKDGRLEQRIRVIQHNTDAFNEVGIHEEWHPVIVEDQHIEEISVKFR